MLDIRRYERNYLVFGSAAEREKVEKLIVHADSSLKIAYEIAPESERESVQELSRHFTVYSNSFSMLVEHTLQNPPEDRINTIKNRFSKSFNEFQSNYRHILTMLNQASEAERDSIIAIASEHLDASSFDRLINIETSSDQSVLPSYIQENLDNSRQSFLLLANDLAEKSWKNVLNRKNESQRIEARAIRNILSVLILTGIICIFLVTLLPQRIVRPIKVLNRILKHAGKGDFSTQAPIYTNDEIGELAGNYNDVLDQLRLYDNLKTGKIASQKRILDRLLENLPMPVCIVTINFIAPFYNTSFAQIFGSSVPIKPPDGGLEIENIEVMNNFADELKKKMSGTKNNIFLDIHDRDGEVVKLKGRLIRNSVMELESVVIVGVSEKT